MVGNQIIAVTYYYLILFKRTSIRNLRRLQRGMPACSPARRMSRFVEFLKTYDISRFSLSILFPVTFGAPAYDDIYVSDRSYTSIVEIGKNMYETVLFVSRSTAGQCVVQVHQQGYCMKCIFRYARMLHRSRRDDLDRIPGARCSVAVAQIIGEGP